MISMSQVVTIRQLRKSGESIASISRITGVSRDTVCKYLALDDLSPKMPVKRPGSSMMDQYRSVIEGWLDEDARSWRKQRHTAARIHARLRDECGCEAGESTVRHYVARLKAERGESKEAFLDLVWARGEAQADFGEADFYVGGVRRRMLYFVVTFPHSNVGLAQVFPGQNAECVCQVLRSIFEYCGGVPARIVFDNATGVGRKACSTARTAEMFAAFSAHYGFDYSFCNPDSGNEKGNVENKVGFIRRNLFVPVPRIGGTDIYNRRLLDRCMRLSEQKHWRKGEPEARLFAEDRVAMAGLPENPFDVVRYVRPKADKYGRVRIEGKHLYSTDPALAGTTLIVGLGATDVRIYDEEGAFVCSHERAYGDAPSDSSQPASQIATLCSKPGGWTNGKVRACMPDMLRGHLDGKDKSDLRASLRTMRDEVAVRGWDATVTAMEMALIATGRVDAASVAVAAARCAGGAIAYDEPVDLSEYDRALGIGGR